jgi:ribonuclease BN (tRNA processing enzyme)
LIELQDQKILLDCGPGTMRRLLETGTSIFDLTHLCLSHFHPDHSGELVPLLFATKYAGNEQRQNALTLVAGQGIEAFYDGLRTVYGPWIELAPGLLRIQAMATHQPATIAMQGFTLQTAPVEHNPESLAFRINSPDGKAVVYSGDTDFNEKLIDLAQGADLLICESAFPDAQKVPGHLSPSFAGQIAQRADVGQLILTHFYPVCEQADLLGECRRSFSGPVVLAKDLLQLRL